MIQSLPEQVVGDILVVDDEVPNLKLLSDILADAGHRVRPARSPFLAIESALARPPDLILLDVRMPDLDGFEVCRRLKQNEKTCGIPIIFVSALQDVEDRVRGFEHGGVDFVSKPYQESEILARVRTHLALHKLQAGLERQVAERTIELTERNHVLVAEMAQRNLAEAELRESRRFNDHLIEKASVMIVVLDTQGRVTLANPAVEAVTGYAVSELLGTEWVDIVVPERERSDVRKAFATVLAGMGTGQYENAIVTRSGEERIVAWSNTVIEDEGEVIATLSFGVDITERRAQSLRLQVYQTRLKALATELTISEERERRRLAEVLHDGPIQVLAFARMRLAAARKQVDERERELAMEEVSLSLRRAAMAASRVVSDLSSPALKELGLAAAISDWAGEQIESQGGIEVVVVDHLKPSEAKQLDDVSRAILFRNARELLTNVAKHAKASSVSVNLERVGEDLELTVRDNGVGCHFDAALADKCDEGGFGLFSIRERMSDLGGAFEIDSHPGQGFVATLVLPLRRDGSGTTGSPYREFAGEAF